MDKVVVVAEKHPKQVAAEIRAASTKELRAVHKRNATHLTETLGLHYVHIRATKNTLMRSGVGPATDIVVPMDLQNGGITVAWRRMIKYGGRPGSVIELATAICNPVDSYCKADGRRHAAENFQFGGTIRLPVRSDQSATQLIRAAFEGFVYE